MSTLAEQTGAGDVGPLPGYTLSPLDLHDFGELETFFNREHLHDAGVAAEGLPEPIANKILRNAQDDKNAGIFRYGEPAFDVKLIGNTALSLMLQQSLKKTKAGITIEQARALLTPENQAEVKKTLLVFSGFNFRKNAVAPGESGSQSTGSPSLTPSGASTETDAKP